MASEVVKGIPELAARLRALTPELRKGAVKKAMRQGGLVVMRRASQAGVVPILSGPIYRRGVLIRKPHTLQIAIKVRNSRDVNRTGDVGVFVNVLPAKGAERGKYSPNDPFYWRFQEFGTRYIRARPFLRTGALLLTGPALQAIEKSLGPQIQQMNLQF